MVQGWIHRPDIVAGHVPPHWTAQAILLIVLGRGVLRRTFTPSMVAATMLAILQILPSGWRGDTPGSDALIVAAIWALVIAGSFHPDRRRAYFNS